MSNCLLLGQSATPLPLMPGLNGSAFVLAIVAGGLVVLSLGVVVQVMLASRNKKFSFRTIFSGLMSLVWTIPVLVTVGFFAFRVAATVDHWDADDIRPSKPRNSETVNFTSLETLPAWTKEEAVRDPQTGKIRTMVISVREASVEEAERVLAVQARNLFEREVSAGNFEKRMTNRLLRYPPEIVAAHAKGKAPVQIKGIETVFVSAPGGDDRTYSNEAWEVYWQLDFSPERRTAIREAAAVPRLWMLGGGVGLLALILFAVATYLRLDHATQGRYRFRLKFATTTLIVATGLLASAVLPIA